MRITALMPYTYNKTYWSYFLNGIMRAFLFVQYDYYYVNLALNVVVIVLNRKCNL